MPVVMPSPPPVPYVHPLVRTKGIHEPSAVTIVHAAAWVHRSNPNANLTHASHCCAFAYASCACASLGKHRKEHALTARSAVPGECLAKRCP